MSKRVWRFGLAVVLALSIGQMNAAAAKRVTSGENEGFYKELDFFGDVLDRVQSDYVEETQPKQLIYVAFKGMLATLDPYSQFLDPDSYNDLKCET